MLSFTGKIMFVIVAWALMTVALLYPHSIHAQCEPIQFANVNGRAVAYHVLGNATGTPLIFINGGPGFLPRQVFSKEQHAVVGVLS